MRTLEEIRQRCFITDDGHWLWRGAVMADGRPRIYAPNYTRGGAMTVQNGMRAVWHCSTQQPVPAGYRCYGTCDEKACCNPAHIRCTTEAEFGKWIERTGKYKGLTQRILATRAAGRKRAALTPEQALYVQTSDKTGLALADELGVSRATVSKYRRGEAVAVQPSAGLFMGLIAANQHGKKRA